MGRSWRPMSTWAAITSWPARTWTRRWSWRRCARWLSGARSRSGPWCRCLASTTHRVLPRLRSERGVIGTSALAVERVYREHRARMLAALVRALDDFELAEDALQDACALALRRWGDTV